MSYNIPATEGMSRTGARGDPFPRVQPWGGHGMGMRCFVQAGAARGRVLYEDDDYPDALHRMRAT